MKVRQGLLSVGLAIAVMFLNSSVLQAAGPYKVMKSDIQKVDNTKKLHVKPKNQLKLNVDLEVVSVVMTPTSPVAGETVTVVAKVKNSGKIKTPQVDTQFVFWNTKGGPANGGQFSTASSPVPPLNPGGVFEFKTITTFITIGDNVGILAKVDKFNKLSEINKKNNEKIIFCSVQCKPELALYDYIKPKPSNISVNAHPDKEFSLTVWVYNNAWCYSKPATLIIGGDELWPFTVNIPPINPRQRVGIPVSLKWSQPGTKYCKITVDSTNTNNESIENNNDMELIVFVLSGGWPEVE